MISNNYNSKHEETHVKTKGIKLRLSIILITASALIFSVVGCADADTTTASAAPTTTDTTATDKTPGIETTEPE